MNPRKAVCFGGNPNERSSGSAPPQPSEGLGTAASSAPPSGGVLSRYSPNNLLCQAAPLTGSVEQRPTGYVQLQDASRNEVSKLIAKATYRTVDWTPYFRSIGKQVAPQVAAYRTSQTARYASVKFTVTRARKLAICYMTGSEQDQSRIAGILNSLTLPQFPNGSRLQEVSVSQNFSFDTTQFAWRSSFYMEINGELYSYPGR